jgi:hypothetical protein
VTVKTRPATAHRSMSVTPTRAVLRRGVVGIAALAIGAVSVPGAGAATTHVAAPPDTGRLCKPGYLWLDIGGKVLNETDVTLKRVRVQTGFLNIDAPVPRPEVAPHGTNKWCIKAATFPLAGAEIAVEYLLPNGDKVSFRGSVFPTIFGGGSEGCHVTGPRPTYTCKATRTHRGPHADVNFVVAPHGR